jgi:predicted secreted protein
MGWVTGCVLYLLIWWLVLFATLPIGANPARDTDPRSGWRGAPEQPRMLMKIGLTTVIAAAVWFGAYLLIHSDYLSFRHGMFAAPQDF